jgi:hypothetical protein
LSGIKRKGKAMSEALSALWFFLFIAIMLGAGCVVVWKACWRFLGPKKDINRDHLDAVDFKYIGICPAILTRKANATYRAQRTVLYIDFEDRLASLDSDYEGKLKTLNTDYKAQSVRLEGFQLAALKADYKDRRAPLDADYIAKCNALEADYTAKRDALFQSIVAIPENRRRKWRKL